jgi:hypothetical protein
MIKLKTLFSITIFCDKLYSGGELNLLNIIGISISFIGTVVAVFDLIMSKPKSEGGTTWNFIGDLEQNTAKSRNYTILGLSLIGIGFAFQLSAAILAL